MRIMKELEEKPLTEQSGSSRTSPPHRVAASPLRVFLVLAFVLLAFAGLFIFGYQKYLERQRLVVTAAHSAQDKLPVVIVEKVRRAAGAAELTLPGNITPVTEAYVYARAAGYVRQRYADIGDRVRGGQVLAEIEAPELDQQVQQARAALSQSERQLEQAKADLGDARAKMELARVTWDRYKVLVDHGAVSQQEGDQQLAAFRSTSATVTSVEARIGSAEQNVNASRANMERLAAIQEFERVRAPFSGVVTARNFDVGALISGSGGSMGQGQGGGLSGPSTGAQGGELFRIAQIGVLRVLVNVPESNAPAIRTGQPASVMVQAFPNREFGGRITRTSNAVDISSRTMLTEVQVQNPEFLLLPGMFVQVRLTSPRVVPPLLIPGDCVMATAKGLRVAVLEDLKPRDPGAALAEADRSYPPQAKRIHLQEIRVGRDYGQMLEVVGGLQGWEYIVRNPGDEIEEGAVVQPVSSPGPEGAEGRQSKKPGSE